MANNEIADPRSQSAAYSGFDPLMVCGDAMSLRTIKRCYQKHVLDDPSIGWDELADEMANALAQIMGDDEFQDWLRDAK